MKKINTRSFLECNPTSSRIIQIRIATQYQNQHYPGLSTEEDIESFNELEEAIENSNERHYLIVMGDWNAQIGGDTIPD